MELRRRLFFALLTLLVVATLSVSGYLLLGGHSITFLQALYMAVLTLAGEGGEIIDTSMNPALRVFNMFVVMFGVTITVYVFSVVTAFLVGGEIKNIFWRRKMQRRISEVSDHYIVCGLGDTGKHAVEELQKTGTPYVVVETHEDNVKRFCQHGGKIYNEMLYVIGDATDDQVLDDAGIGRAKGLIAALAVEKDNLVITVMVRQKNPRIRIVARCTDPKFSDKMIKAGANSTVSPNLIGGLRLASEMLRPHVVGFLDMMMKEKSRTVRIEEIEIERNSAWIGRSLAELDLRGAHNILPVAVRQPAEEKNYFHVNPSDNLRLQAGSVLIVIGDVEDIRRGRLSAKPETAEAARA